jgi:hypothetical protein
LSVSQEKNKKSAKKCTFLFFCCGSGAAVMSLCEVMPYGGVCALCAGYCGVAAITHALRALLR